MDKRILEYNEAIHKLIQGDYAIRLNTPSDDELGQLGTSLDSLIQYLRQRHLEAEALGRLSKKINTGLLLDEILESVYQDFNSFIPYDRIGLALLSPDKKTVTSHWAKSRLNQQYLVAGYSAELTSSSLAKIISSGQPRIIDDLEVYLLEHPNSTSTKMILKEGIRSSLTCPLVANDIPIGFIFFSSAQKDAYDHNHIEAFQRITEQLSIIVEKGRLVSELAEKNEFIENQNLDLRRLNEQRNAFLGFAAHDLRSPIGSIQMMSSLLLESRDLIDKEREEFLKEIQQQADYMLQLLNDILDVTQIESGKLSIKPKLINLATYLYEAVSRHEKLAEYKGSHVVLETIPSGTVQADPVRVRQILDNLISNAVKFSPPGSVIRVRVARFRDHWRVEIVDQGPGITEKDRERLFEDFARLSAKPTAGEKSSGLGLAITRRMIHAHGGKIGVESNPGERPGSTFWFTLPNEIAHP
jgi:signal transduction histidine kinase